MQQDPPVHSDFPLIGDWTDYPTQAVALHIRKDFRHVMADLMATGPTLDQVEAQLHLLVINDRIETMQPVTTVTSHLSRWAESLVDYRQIAQAWLAGTE